MWTHKNAFGVLIATISGLLGIHCRKYLGFAPRLTNTIAVLRPSLRHPESQKSALCLDWTSIDVCTSASYPILTFAPCATPFCTSQVHGPIGSQKLFSSAKLFLHSTELGMSLCPLCSISLFHFPHLSNFDYNYHKEFELFHCFIAGVLFRLCSLLCRLTFRNLPLRSKVHTHSFMFVKPIRAGFNIWLTKKPTSRTLSTTRLL